MKSKYHPFLRSTRLAAAIASLALASSSQADIILVAEYHLGEAGSVSDSNTWLYDSATGGTPAGAQDLVGSNWTPSSTWIATTGVSAPGSTAYLDTSTGGAGWETGNTIGTLATDNFAFGIYARAASIQSRNVFYLGDQVGGFGFGMATNGWAASANNVEWIGGVDGVGGSFTANTWVHLALVRTSGATAFYINGVQQGGTYAGAPVHNSIGMNFSPGPSGGFFQGNLDEARVVTFDAADAGAGNINVLNALQGIPDPFANWMSTNYPGIVSPDNQPGADPDKDGIANLIEYVLQGGDPSVSTTGTLPTLDASGLNFVFTYFRRAAATGTTQTFEYGTNLSDWTPVAIPGGSGVVVTPNNPISGIDRVAITVAKGANTKLFGRLQAVK